MANLQRIKAAIYTMEKRAEDTDHKVLQVLKQEGGAAGMKALRKQVDGDVKGAVRRLAKQKKLYTHPDGDIIKTSQAKGTAVKRDPAKWEAAKRQAKAKMGGKHSARAMQLAVQIYKKSGGTYKGKKPSASTNKMRKWTKQKWRTRPGTSSIAQRSDGSTARYLPEKKWKGMSKKEQIKTDVAKLKERKQYVANTERAKVRSKFKYY